MRRLRLVLVLAVLGLGGAGCKRLETGAKEDFAHKYSCPEDRVTVKERSDLSPQEVHDGPKKKSKKDEPPPEVAADPARLAKWQKDRADKEESRSDGYGGYGVFEATGCDHHDILLCHHPSSGRRGGTQSNVVSCNFYAP